MPYGSWNQNFKNKLNIINISYKKYNQNAKKICSKWTY